MVKQFKMKMFALESPGLQLIVENEKLKKTV